MGFVNVEPLVAVIAYVIINNSNLTATRYLQAQVIVSILFFTLFFGGFIFSVLGINKYVNSSLILDLGIFLIPTLIACDLFYYLIDKLYIDSIIGNNLTDILLFTRFKFIIYFINPLFYLSIAVLLLKLYFSSEFKHLAHWQYLKIIVALLFILAGAYAFFGIFNPNLTEAIMIHQAAESVLALWFVILHLVFTIIAAPLMLKFGNELNRTHYYMIDQLPT